MKNGVLNSFVGLCSFVPIGLWEEVRGLCSIRIERGLTRDVITPVYISRKGNIIEGSRTRSITLTVEDIIKDERLVVGIVLLIFFRIVSLLDGLGDSILQKATKTLNFKAGREGYILNWEEAKKDLRGGELARRILHV